MRWLIIVPRRAVVVLAFGFAISTAAEEQTSGAQNAKVNSGYEVVSIKASKTGTPGTSAILPNGFRDTSTTLGMVFRTAFGMFYDRQIVGLPLWTETDLYDIEAKVDSDTAASG